MWQKKRGRNQLRAALITKTAVISAVIVACRVLKFNTIFADIINHCHQVISECVSCEP